MSFYLIRTQMLGQNSYGQLGQGNTANLGDDENEMGNTLTAIDLGSSFDVSTVDCGGYHACAMSTDHGM